MSGILVVVPPTELEAHVAALSELPGVEVSHLDPATGKVVVIQEARTISEEVEGLKRIKALASVISAEMVYHFFEEDTESYRDLPAELDGSGDLGTRILNS